MLTSLLLLELDDEDAEGAAGPPPLGPKRITVPWMTGDRSLGVAASVGSVSADGCSRADASGPCADEAAVPVLGPAPEAAFVGVGGFAEA